jgi:hypothetical protein
LALTVGQLQGASKFFLACGAFTSIYAAHKRYVEAEAAHAKILTSSLKMADS